MPKYDQYPPGPVDIRTSPMLFVSLKLIQQVQILLKPRTIIGETPVDLMIPLTIELQEVGTIPMGKAIKLAIMWIMSPGSGTIQT